MVFNYCGTQSTANITQGENFPFYGISETDRPIAIIFYMKHHWGRGRAALGFGADQIRTQDPGDNKTYLSHTMTISYAKLIIGTTYQYENMFM